MKENTSVLRSDYIIDGIRRDATPKAMLDLACERESGTCAEEFEKIVDESVDPTPFAEEFEPGRADEYLEAIRTMGPKGVPFCYSASYTNGKIAGALLDALWQAGHFRLGDLAVSALWKWNDKAIGSMAAFYDSVESACDYLEGLGVMMKDYSVQDCETMALEVSVSLSDQPQVSEFENIEDEEDFFAELPFQTEHPTLRHTRKCPQIAKADPKDWVIYIPFDTGSLLLGGSALSQATGKPCGKAPAIDAADYFIDCYEVVRELVEDGIVRAGVSVGEGGMMTALRKLIPEGMGMNVEVGGIMKSYGEGDLSRILFSEVPGAIIVISDDDYDYVDAELLLQDVAYYPLGHISGNTEGIKTSVSDNSDITEILQSLLSGQVSEGED